MKIAILVALTIVSMLGGCTNPATMNGNSAGDIRNVWWKLESFEPVTGGSITLRASEEYLVLFADTSLSGKDSLCGNIYSASCRIGGDGSISIGSVGTTKIYCQSSYNYSNYLRALEVVTSFRITGNRLTVFHDGGAKKLEFVKP